MSSQKLPQAPVDDVFEDAYESVMELHETHVNNTPDAESPSSSSTSPDPYPYPEPDIEQQEPLKKNKFGTLKFNDTMKGMRKAALVTGKGSLSILEEFKAFICRGNVIDLAVGLVMGAAFTAIVTSLVNDLITPLIGLAMGGVSLTNLFIVMRPGKSGAKWYPTTEQAAADGAVTWNYGNFLQTLLNFLVISACMFFLVRFVTVLRLTKTELPNEMECTYCKKQISKSASRCPFCTSQVIPEVVDDQTVDNQSPA